METANIKLFRWGGAWGPFKVNIPCGECTLTKNIIDDVMTNELAGIPVTLEVNDWLTYWWRPLFKGGWHAPIILVDDKVIFQGGALNRGVLTQAVIESYCRKAPIVGNHIFGKANCSHCMRSKEHLNQAGIEHQYHDVVKEPEALYEMLGRVKPIIGNSVPVTVPQIWLDGKYIGGASELREIIKAPVIPGHDQG
ncbi:glutaredoxin [Candidatus Sororendozoicomonas aggregata]|uniref:glutaredoxin n=1 Tax=Candidatus Sororendozoicomonas aggregata TaxID=3073239 RepID=UPI002ED26AB6